MPEDPQVREKQEQLAGKLKWLINRARPDFKGNQPAFAQPKTLQSVVRAKKCEESKLAGESDFMPFWHGKVPLGYIATKGSVIRGKDEIRMIEPVEPVDENHPSHNPYRQRLDPATQKPEVYTALTWQEKNLGNAVVTRTGKKLFQEKCQPTSTLNPPEENKWRPQRKDIDGHAPLHQLQTLRKDALLHPKFTAESRLAHAEAHWDPMSQLLSHAFLEPPKRQVPKVAAKANKIRMVDVMRRTSSAHAWR